MKLKFIIITIALIALGMSIAPYLFHGSAYYTVNLRPIYHGAPLKPLFPSKDFIVGALGLREGGWQDWAIDMILRRKDDPELIEMVKQAAESEYPCTKASAKFVLFKLRIDPSQNLKDIFELISERKSACPMNLIIYKIGPEDAEYSDTVVSILRTGEIQDVQIAGRVALRRMGWSKEELDELGLRPWTEYPEE